MALAVPPALDELPVRELRELLRERGISDAGCLEKGDLIARLQNILPGSGLMDDADEGLPRERQTSPGKPSVASEWLGLGADAGPREQGLENAAAAEVEKPSAEAAAPVADGARVSTAAVVPRGPNWREVGQLLSRGQRLAGSVKLCNPDKGFAFIECDEVRRILQRDVFVFGRELESETELVVGDKVSFLLRLDTEGRPQARALKVEESGPIPCPDAPGRGINLDPEAVYRGTVKSFNAETGFGFITCDETYAVFNRDVFLHHSQRAGFEVGEAVRFRIHVDPVKGTPKAKDLAPPTGTFPACSQAAKQATSPWRTGEEEMDEAPRSGGRPVCRHFILKGVCVMGENCRYAHTEDEPQASARKELKDVCAHHLAGNCSRVDCGKRHPEGEEAEVLCELAKVIPCLYGRSCRTQNCLYSHPGNGNAVELALGGNAVELALGAKRRDGSAPPRCVTCPSADADAASDVGLPPPPLRPAPAADPEEAEVQLVAASAEEEEQLKGTEANLSGEPGHEAAATGSCVGTCNYTKYTTEDGSCIWWWCESDGDWFLEVNPGPWEKYSDPVSRREYWWKNDKKWFFV